MNSIPNLYTLHCGLQGFGTITDDRQLTLGFVGNGKSEGVLYLNGHPAFMRYAALRFLPIDRLPSTGGRMVT